jgi:hypothetical protein
MLKLFSGLVVGLLAVVSTAQAFGPDGKRLKKEFQALYDR